MTVSHASWLAKVTTVISDFSFWTTVCGWWQTCELKQQHWLKPSDDNTDQWTCWSKLTGPHLGLWVKKGVKPLTQYNVMKIKVICFSMGWYGEVVVCIYPHGKKALVQKQQGYFCVEFACSRFPPTVQKQAS